MVEPGKWSFYLPTWLLGSQMAGQTMHKTKKLCQRIINKRVKYISLCRTCLGVALKGHCRGSCWIACIGARRLLAIVGRMNFNTQFQNKQPIALAKSRRLR